MSKAVVIGGGIVGLSSAYYLQQAGWQVTVLDKGDFSNNCSYGNAGYVCPSHFVPLAAPGIVWQGIKWMFNPESPFYIKPRFSSALIHWGWHFMRSANAGHVQRSAVPLRDIALLSRSLYEQWTRLPGFDFAYQHRGLLEFFQTDANEAHAHHTAEAASRLGLEARVCSAEEARALEPGMPLDIKGALYYGCDAHLQPNLVMRQMGQYLKEHGVTMEAGAEVVSMERHAGQVKEVRTRDGRRYSADLVVLAAGSWSRELGALLDLRLPLVGGRGYSVTLDHSPIKIKHPIILVEGRVALTPFSDTKVRMGGTMEITRLDAPPRMSRVKGIYKAVCSYFPGLQLPEPAVEEVWSGFRPCSADGLPFIGRVPHLPNCLVATGHAMIGMSLGAATGKLVSELAQEEKTSVDLTPYRLDRF